MSYFLAKTDPQTYSISDLEREGKTTWDGVRNNTALLAIKAMRPGDDVLIYHSQGESAIIGLAKVISEPRPDPNDAKSWVIDLEFVKKLAMPVTLQQIKQTGQFNDWNLVRMSRLSTMPVPDKFIEWLQEKNAL